MTDLLFGATEPKTKLVCVLRDGTEYEFDGPPNCQNGDYKAVFRFSLGTGFWSVTFRKFPNSDRYGEIEASKDMIDIPL